MQFSGIEVLFTAMQVVSRNGIPLNATGNCCFGGKPTELLHIPSFLIDIHKVCDCIGMVWQQVRHGTYTLPRSLCV